MKGSGLFGRSTDTMLVFDLDQDVDQLLESRTDGVSLHKYPEYKGEVLHLLPTAEPPSLERRYCVESRGRLLMVERYCRCYRNYRRTCLFMVFQRAPIPPTFDGDAYEAWVKLESLDGEVLFLGGSDPRSFAASEHEGNDADCIYFADDHCQRKDKNFSRGSEDEDWFGV